MTSTTLNRPREETTRINGVLALFLVTSGAVALVYEMVWQRQFALVFGSAAPATAAVLAAYFAGLGLGSLAIGRFAARWARPLRGYALLEIGIGVGALLVTPLLAWFETGYPWVFRAFAGNPAAFVAVRTGVVFLALLMPTFCMGGTLPLLGKIADHGRKQLGLTAGGLYVANTVGAGIGALSVPFVLLPNLGMANTVWLCAAFNGTLATLAWGLDRRRGADLAPPISIPPAKRRAVRAMATVSTGPAVLVPALVSGVVTFALQVLWNRAFAQVHENSLYSFAVIVAVVIFALAIGAQVSRVGLRRGVEPHRLIGVAWMVAGAAVAAGPWLFLRLTKGMSYLPVSGGWIGHAAALVGLAAVLLLVPMALLGIGLPAIMETAGRSSEDDAGWILGRLLGVNVAGSVAGSLLAGFVLPTWAGLWSGVIGLGTLLLAAGLWQWRGASRLTGLAVAAGWLVSLGAIARLDFPRVRLSTTQEERLLALAEGAHGITAVTQRSGSRRIKLNNHYALGGTAATGDERMQAHVPLLLHPRPRSVAFLGLGTGITAGGALFHPVERITAMELVPEVVSAARTHFREANEGVLEDARTRVVEDDARHYLRGSGERFDVIVGDLVVPWRQGEGALFTLEQFKAAREALAPDGIFCQWLPLFQLSREETLILVRTFLEVFPRAQIWRGDFSPTEPAIGLIGGTGSFHPDPATVRRRIAEMRDDPANPHLASVGIFWMHGVGGIEKGDFTNGDTRLNREDRPWIELLGPMRHAGGRGEGLFTGRRLQAWLDEIQARANERGVALPEAERSVAKEGRTLAEMTLKMAENDQAGARAAREQLRGALPREAFRVLFPE